MWIHTYIYCFLFNVWLYFCNFCVGYICIFTLPLAWIVLLVLIFVNIKNNFVNKKKGQTMQNYCFPKHIKVMTQVCHKTTSSFKASISQFHKISHQPLIYNNLRNSAVLSSNGLHPNLEEQCPKLHFSSYCKGALSR